MKKQASGTIVRAKQAGFTLIELLAIIAVLAGAAHLTRLLGQ